MTEEYIIDSLCGFLSRHVAPLVKLKVANDDAYFDVREAHPAVYPVYHPMVDNGQPPDKTAQMAPALTVMPREGVTQEADTEPETLGIRIVVVAWDPGIRIADEKKTTNIRKESGASWRAMCNLRELTKQALRKATHIDGLRIRGPFRTGLYSQRDAMPDVWPYCFGWLDFSVEHGERIHYDDMVRALIE